MPETGRIEIATPLGADKLGFRRMVGAERIGRLFQFDLELASADEQINFDDILGQNATISFHSPFGEVRFFNGFVTSFSYAGREENFALYRAVLRPWCWFLTRTSDCRIFQEKTAPEIIEEVFREQGFTDFEVSLSEPYRTWEYCVQYRETDFDFVSRLMEQEGIYYYFRHEDGKHTLILSDSYSSHEPAEGYESVPYFPPSDSRIRDKECISKWAVSREIQPGSCALNDYDFERPRADLEVKATIPRDHAQGGYEVYDYPGEYAETGDGEFYARKRIEEAQTRFEQIRGAGNACGLMAGALFQLTGFPRDDQNREYLIVAVDHELTAGEFRSGAAGEENEKEIYECTIETLNSRQPYRSARTTPRPEIKGPQTAVVVGKEGEEIWTDKYGRVKVQFPWDRQGKVDEKSSCWLRVAQVWAGKNWGGIHIPRIGQEVIVEFLEGDPDRPIVTGCVYNDAVPPPYDLPGMATVSGFKSNSSKGGEGFNELRFEDKKGEEQIFVHGEKNLDIRVKNDRYETIEHDRHLHVENDKVEHVDNNRNETVGADHIEEIAKDRHLKVAGKEAIEVGDSRSVTVKGDVIEVFNANHSEQTKGEYYVVADDIIIEGKTSITIKVGQSYIAIDSNGIRMETTGRLELEASSTVDITGASGVAIDSPGTAEMTSSATTIKGDATVSVSGGTLAEVKGGVVKIN